MHHVATLRREQLDVGIPQVHGVHGDEIRSGHAEAIEPRERAHRMGAEALLELVARLLQMRLDRQVELPRVNDDFLPARVAYGIWSMWRQRKGELRLASTRRARRGPPAGSRRR